MSASRADFTVASRGAVSSRLPGHAGRETTNWFVVKLAQLVKLDPIEVAELQRVTARFRTIAPKVSLAEEGQRLSYMIAILDGWAYRYKILPDGSRRIFAFLMPGDACDMHEEEDVAIDHGIQTATAARVAFVQRDEMVGLKSRHDGILRAMSISRLIDEAALRSHIITMGLRTGAQQLAHLICELYVRSRRLEDAEAGCFYLPLPQNLLADALGMSAVHVNRVLHALSLVNAVQLRHGRLCALNPDQLANIAGFDVSSLR